MRPESVFFYVLKIIIKNNTFAKNRSQIFMIKHKVTTACFG